MGDFNNGTVFYINWQGGTPLVRDWCMWLEIVTPVICMFNGGELP
jgi:hypothetical protein